MPAEVDIDKAMEDVDKAMEIVKQIQALFKVGEERAFLTALSVYTGEMIVRSSAAEKIPVDVLIARIQSTVLQNTEFYLDSLIQPKKKMN